MLRLTWRNLLARKVRLLMSTLAIVLGIGFLAGVMTFSTGLNATFENIVSGSTSDAMVRPAGEVSAANAGVATTQRITPADIDKLSAPARGGGRRPGRSTASAPTCSARTASWSAARARPTLAFNYAPGENMAGEQILHAAAGRLAREARRGHAGHVLGGARRLRDRRHRHDDRADREQGPPTYVHPRRHRGLQRRRHGRRHPRPARHRARRRTSSSTARTPSRASPSRAPTVSPRRSSPPLPPRWHRRASPP